LDIKAGQINTTISYGLTNKIAIQVYGNSAGKDGLYYLRDLLERELHKNTFIVEPNLFVRLGGEKLKCSLIEGLCLAHKFTNTKLSLPILIINVGLAINYKFHFN